MNPIEDTLYQDTETEPGIAIPLIYKRLFVHNFGRHGEQRVDQKGRVYYQNRRLYSLNKVQIDKILEGKRTFAGYGCNRKGKSKWVMFDLDIPRVMRREIEAAADLKFRNQLEDNAWQSIFLMAENIIREIKWLGFTPIPIFSGSKGVHIYVLFDKLIPLEKAVHFGLLIKWLTHNAEEGKELAGLFKYLEIESYPCLADIGNYANGGLPHLVKHPLALHRGSRMFSRFLDPDNLRLGNWLPNSHVLELKPDSAQSVLDILHDFEEEVKEALKQSRTIDFEPEPTNSPSSEKYLRLNIPQGPEKVIERCLALKLLREKVKKQHHLTHDERLFILFTMLAFAGGEGEKTVHELMQQASDYDFKRTQYFIDHAKHRAYKPFLCQKAQAKGICPLADPCPAVGDYRTPLGTVTGFNAANRAKVRPMVGAITTTLVTGTIEEIRHELPEITYKYLRDHEDKALLIQTDPGVGKTTTIAKAITNLPKDLSYIKRIFWAGQRHDMYDEVAEHIPNLKQILPKIGSDQADPDKNPEKYGLCGLDEKRKQLRTLRDKGWSEIETEKVCLDCYYGPKNCDYFQQWSHTGSFFAPQQHLVTSRIQKNKLRCDLIVVDEDPANVFDGETIVTQHDIDKMTEFLQDRKFAHTELMIRFLDNLRRSIASHKKLTQGHELLKTFDDKIRLQSGVDPSQLDMLSDDIKPQLPEGLHELINSINKTRFWIDWASFIEIADPKQLPKNWLAPLFKAIEQEKLLFGVKHNSRIYVKKQETQMVLGIFDTEIFNPENVPIIFLDATADPDTYRRIINRELVHIVHRVPLKNKIYQLIDGEYPKQSIMPNTPWSQRARNKLLKFTKAIIERGQKTLVVSTKDFHEMHLVKHLKHARLKRKYYTGYYRNLRGSNDYEKCDQVVLIGVALPNMAEIHIREQARRLQEDYISDETVKQYHQYGQSKLEGQTRVYEDERMNRVLEQHREYEMEQAIFRIRPLQNPEKKIWILSSIPLPLEANIKIINGEELSTILGLDMNKKHDRILRRMISSAKKILNEKVNKEFTVRRLANTAKVAEKTVRTYSKSICDAIPGLEKVHGGFKYNPPEIENPFE